MSNTNNLMVQAESIMTGEGTYSGLVLQHIHLQNAKQAAPILV